MKSKILIASATSLLLTGCLESDDNSDRVDLGKCDADTPNMVIQTSVYGEGRTSSVAIGCAREASLTDSYLVKAGESDYTVSAGKSGFYHIGRGSISTLTKHDYANPNLSDLGFSTNKANDGSSNPYSVSELNSEKAYVIRYNKGEVWAFNPTAQNADDFKISEIDLSAYTNPNAEEGTNTPNASASIIVNGKLFVAMQRILLGGYNYDYSGSSAVAVIDTTTDSEIDTTPNTATDSKAIQLTGSNITTIQYHNGLLYTASQGDYNSGEAGIFGAIESINPTDYSTRVVIQGSVDTGHLHDIAIVSDTLGYFYSTDAGYGNGSLYSFNPQTGADITAIEAFADKSIQDIATGPDGYLWIALESNNGGEHGVYKLDTQGVEETQFLSTELTPRKIDFKSN